MLDESRKALPRSNLRQIDPKLTANDPRDETAQERGLPRTNRFLSVRGAEPSQFCFRSAQAAFSKRPGNDPRLRAFSLSRRVKPGQASRRGRAPNAPARDLSEFGVRPQPLIRSSRRSWAILAISASAVAISSRREFFRRNSKARRIASFRFCRAQITKGKPNFSR